MKYRGYNEIFTEFCTKLNDNIKDCKSRTNKILDFLSENEKSETIKVYLDVLIGSSLFEDFIPNYITNESNPIPGEVTYIIGSYLLDEYINVELHIDMMKRITDHNYQITNENGKKITYNITPEEADNLF